MASSLSTPQKIASGEKVYASVYRMNVFSVALDLIPQISCGVTKTNDRFTVKYSLRFSLGR